MISILITHYNRIDSLKECLAAFRSLDRFEQSFEIVVSDDCSVDAIKIELGKLQIDTLLIADRNTGLSSNLNRGLKACKGDYILYCQEDFLPKQNLPLYLKEAIELLDCGHAQMCRLKANYRFPELHDLSPNFKLIPKFSFKNFYYNAFQYSDHPFITTPSFFMNYGFFLDGVSGPYGENEYAIRVMKSNARIAIANKHPFEDSQDAKSVIQPSSQRKKRKLLKKLKLHKFVRAVRLHLEFLLYKPSKRRLMTIKNKKSDNA